MGGECTCQTLLYLFVLIILPQPSPLTLNHPPTTIPPNLQSKYLKLDYTTLPVAAEYAVPIVGLQTRVQRSVDERKMLNQVGR